MTSVTTKHQWCLCLNLLVDAFLAADIVWKRKLSEHLAGNVAAVAEYTLPHIVFKIQ